MTASQPDPRDLYAGWTAGEAPFTRGVLRVVVGKRVVWACRHAHLGRRFAMRCAQAELDRQKQAAP